MRPSDPSTPMPVSAGGFADPAFAASVLEASADCIKFIDLDGKIRFMNGLGLCLNEIDDFSEVEGRTWASMWPQHHGLMIAEALEEARAGRVARFSGECPTAKGVPKWWDVVVSPVLDPVSGKLKGMVAISRDVTASWREKEAAQLLTQEMAHRLKNFFTVIDGLISMSSRRAPEAKEFADIVRARLSALGSAVNYVGPLEAPPDLSLHGLLNDLFAPYGSAEIKVEGDDAIIGRNGSAALALAVHELATNAVKHGALSAPQGRVLVTTAKRDDRYEIVWRETGGPPAHAGTPGFGSTLLENAARTHLDGELERLWTATGLTVRLDLALDALAR